MADPREYVTGSSSLSLGVDSYTIPTDLGDKQYVFGQNTVCRGGIVQTRPGTRSLFCLPDGNFQGATLFTPDNGVAQLVFAVDGKIYVSAAPFTSYRRLYDLQFSITAKYIAWAVCLKSTDYDIDGNIYSLEDPFSVLVMQDGLTRAAYWDGGTARHLNPAPATDVTDVTDAVIQGYNETPIGLWMIWSGNRLWVSRGNQVFASDIGNPLKFTESLYLNEGRAFNLSSPCTGMIEVPSDSAGAKGFIAFTANDGTLFASYIQDRTQWLSTPLFQNTILPNIGCVAPRSLVTQYGLNWWFSPRGLTNVNAAFRQNLSSRIDYQDNQMFASKSYLGPDLSGICACYYENYLMCSVPSGDVLNRHTWTLDQAPFDGNANAWTGIWTGWRPIEWCRGIINGSERVFFGSVDYDGKNRIWEAMLPERTDNGCRITCYAQLRDHAGGNLDQKRYEWTKFFLSQIYGDVDLNVYVASTKGGYQLQKNYRIVATEGQIYADTQYSETGPFLVGNRVQTRTIRTPSDPEDNECNACGVESAQGNMIDYAFSHLLVWSGQMGIRAYQMHMRESPDRNAGDCEEPETGPRVLNESGCSGLQLYVDGQVFEEYTASAEGTTITGDGLDVYIRREAVSFISQENAQAMAECAVRQIINQLQGVTGIACGVYDYGEAEIGSGTYVVVSCREVPPVPVPESARILLVGGGGGGASGGGGGGQVVEVAEFDLEETLYPIVVGAGGAGSVSNDNLARGVNGSDTTGFGQTAIGGGGGGNIPVNLNGSNGGNGGGSGATSTINGTGGTAQPGGFAGGNVTVKTTPFPSAGGGGAGEIGESPSINTQAGSGGDGLISDISGASVRYGAGGGGACFLGNGFGAGGAGGGGNGGALASNGIAGQANTGSGGGGASSARSGGAGGSGIVIVRYPGAARFTGGTVTTFDGDTVHTFTSSGSLTPL